MIEIDGEGPTILFVHGLGGTSNSFQALLGALDGFRCVRPDLPGSGRSPTPAGKLTMDGFVETIGEVIRVIGAAPVHLVAHSMGTTVCQHLAAKMPEWVTSLTLFGPIHEPSDTARQRLKDRARAARQEGMIGIADAVAGGLPSATKRASPLVVPFLRESHMRQDAEGFAQSCEALADAQAADLRLLRCPMLLVTGDEDTVAPPSIAQAIADKVEGATVKVLERCGHWTPVERPQDCARLLSEHVRGTRRLMI
jgi:pimeloyl-ACP methyl ester carboxylesterase